MDGHYILPGELALLIAFLLLPPLLVSLMCQAWFMNRRGVFDNGVLRGSTYLIVTVASSLILAVGLLLFGPDAAGPMLGIRDLRIGEAHVPTWPPAYLLVPILAIIGSWVATRSR
jgi:hypothetical protein